MGERLDHSQCRHAWVNSACDGESYDCRYCGTARPYAVLDERPFHWVPGETVVTRARIVASALAAATAGETEGLDPKGNIATAEGRDAQSPSPPHTGE